jgi:hypothetical protein
MAVLIINCVACAVICAWATWCVLSPKINDGVFGKFLFATVALAALSVVLGPGYGYSKPQAPGVTLHVCIAALGLRQIFIKTIWPAIVARGEKK